MTNHRITINTLLFVLSSVLVFSWNAPVAQGKSKITWLTFGQIPGYISSGEFKNQGFMDKTIKMIQDKVLQDFELEMRQVNHKRFNIDAKKRGNCYIGWKTFSDYRIFSEPIFIWYPTGIIIARHNQEYFGPEGSILSLKALLKNENLKLGVIDSFAYATEIQQLLSEYRDADHLFFVQSGSMQVDLKMLAGKRIDYTIGWPSQPLVEKKLNNVQNNFLYYNIEEDQNYLYIGISCSGCDVGKLVIDRVNDYFSNDEALLEILSYVKEWVVMSDQHQALFNDTILLKKKNPKVIHMKYP